VVHHPDLGIGLGRDRDRLEADRHGPGPGEPIRADLEDFERVVRRVDGEESRAVR
jgi:hypothetical protein